MYDVINERWFVREDYPELIDSVQEPSIVEVDLWTKDMDHSVVEAAEAELTKHIVDIHNFVVQYGGLEVIRKCIELGVAAQFASPMIPEGAYISPLELADSALSEAFCDLIDAAGIEEPA